MAGLLCIMHDYYDFDRLQNSSKPQYQSLQQLQAMLQLAYPTFVRRA